MKKFLLPFFFAGTLVMMLVMAKTGAPLKTTDTPRGILDLEFAYDHASVSKVINAWAPLPNESFGKIETARFNTRLDFIFIFFYSVFLFLACKKIAWGIKGPVAQAGNLIATGALLAGIFDVMENLGMLVSLGGYISGTVAFTTTSFSVLKWILALIALLYIITGLVARAWRSARK